MSEEKGKAFGHRSAEGNYFPTAYSLTEQLFEVEKFNKRKTVLEPACGYMHMSRVLQGHFKKVVSYDIDPEFEIQGDFYKEQRKFRYIITNPPYSGEADKFVMQAKKVLKQNWFQRLFFKKKFAFLLRTNFLSGEGRLSSGIYNGLKNVYIFSRMPDFRSPIRPDGKYKTAMNVYAWMIWEIGYKGKPQLDWISNQEFILSVKDINNESL